MSGGGDPVVGLQGSQPASDIGLSGGGDPVVGLQGSQAASEEGT